MVSKPSFTAGAGAALLAGSAFALGAGWQSMQTASIGASALALLCGAALLHHSIRSMRAIALPVEIPASTLPDSDRMLTLENQLEFAPVALFRAQGGGAIEPLNARARRLLAPGRAADPVALLSTLAGLAAGERRVIELEAELGVERSLAASSPFTLGGLPSSLIALLPMESELAAEAMQARESLIRVLTHEIMNSLTPVASLSRTSRELLDEAGASLPTGLTDDLHVALDAISRRADSLAHFVSGYRAIASVPEARREPVSVRELLARIAALVQPDWNARGGRALFTVEPESLELLADAGQLEQALINLLHNAGEATQGLSAPEVLVSARLARGGRLRIEVADNGPGVAEDLSARIFDPFFTTKPQGSGIGLAMVRQLVHRNGGTIRHARSLTTGARFVLTF